MKKTIEEVFCDVTGKTGATEHRLSIDGTEYAIDLADDEYAKLSTAMADYVRAGRRVSGNAHRRKPTKTATTTTRTHAARDAERARFAEEIDKGLSEYAQRNGNGRPILAFEDGASPVPVQRVELAPDAGTQTALIRSWWRSHYKRLDLPKPTSFGRIPSAVRDAYASDRSVNA